MRELLKVVKAYDPAEAILKLAHAFAAETRRGKEVYAHHSPHRRNGQAEKTLYSQAAQSGIDLRVYNRLEVAIGLKIRNLDAIVIFTNKIAHDAKIKAMNAARANNIPVLLRHSCGICSLQDCIECLKNRSLSSSLL